MSGDKFMIVLGELNGIHDANRIAGKIINTGASDMHVMGKRVHISLSMGVAAYRGDQEETPQSLMKKADVALYQAKRSGGNQYKVYTEVEQKGLF